MLKLLAFAFILQIAAAQTVGSPVVVQNLRLFYGNNEYWVKGMAYSPSPLVKVVENQNWGTGLCTPKRAYTPGTYNIEMTSPCLLEDYFDGTMYPGGPSGGWWNEVWQRDFPMMKSLGVNTLRIYHADPITSLAVKNNSNYIDKTVIGANHIPFLDLAQSYGFKVVFPLYGDEAAIATIPANFMFQYIENLIDEVGYHPAVLMYQFGNELQFLNNDNAYVQKINSYLGYARSYQLKRWGRALPVSTALIDYPPYYNTLVPALDIDIITTNAGYRGWGFQNLWSGGGDSFWGLQKLSCMTGRPTLIGEMGIHSGQPSSVPFDLPGAFPGMMSDLIAHKTSGAIGGFYFEWQEEHWKGVAFVGSDWTEAADVFMGAITLSNGSGQFPIDIAKTKTGTAYDWSAAQQSFAMNPWVNDGPNTLGQTANNFCTGVSTISTGFSNKAKSTTVFQATPATAPVNVNPVPAPAPNGACGATPACNGQCYDPNIYTCTTDFATQKAVLCWGLPANAASCNGQCYNPNNFVCGGSGLYLKPAGVATPVVPSTIEAVDRLSSIPPISTTKSAIPSTTTAASRDSCPASFNCGGGSCCLDGNNGPVCYGATSYACVADGFNGKSYLCVLGGGACNGNCYDASNYWCNEGVVTQK